MKHESRYAQAFEALLKQVRHERPADPPPERDPVTQLIIGFLEWNATRRQAEQAYEQLMEELVDNNDLRVSLPQELLTLIGAKYPQGLERVSRLREVLQEVYHREHAVSLRSLAGKPKKQVRAYLEGLPGITPYVSAQAMLLGFTVHAMPVDDRLGQLLIDAKVVDPKATVREIGQFIERRVKAGEMVATHLALRAWADVQPLADDAPPQPEAPPPPPPKPRSRTKPSPATARTRQRDRASKKK